MNDSTKTSSTRTSASHKVANDPMATNHGLPNESYSMEQSASSSAAPAASIPGPEDHTELHSFLNTLLGDPAQLDELQQAERDILGTNSRPNSISSSSAQAADSIPLLSPEAMREFHAALQQIPPNDSAALAHVAPISSGPKRHPIDSSGRTTMIFGRPHTNLPITGPYVARSLDPNATACQ